MAANAKYTITSDPHYHLESSIKSFGIDHLVQKDLRSFYTNLSSFSYINTGLLPVFGSGLLSLRGAGGHYQVAYQHAPNKYLVNWGAYEGDANAKAYLLAQPYRIVIIDIVDKSIYGARHFYSPYPITHMEAQLYHANLPNLNCKGYTNNVGVGWICLYHNTLSSNIEDFSELVRIGLERTSGVEPYNDQNMSSTDGIRFYKEYYNHDSNYEFLWDPSLWQQKTELEGISWTLNPDLWVPIKVISMDNQSHHYRDGIDFTFRHAILGNYKAYYYDDNVPKLVNIIAREDLQLSSSTIYNIFTKAHNNTISYDPSTEPTPVNQVNQTTLFNKEEDQELDDESFICESCEDVCPEEERIFTVDGYTVCSECSSDIYFVEHLGDYFYHSDSLIFDETSSQYYAVDYLKQNIHYFSCNACGTHHFDTSSIFAYSHTEFYIYPFLDSHAYFTLQNLNTKINISSSLPHYWKSNKDNQYYCINCIESQNSQSSFVIESHNCVSCGTFIPHSPNKFDYISSTDLFLQKPIANVVINPFVIDEYNNLDLYDKYSFYHHYLGDSWYDYCPSCRTTAIRNLYNSQISNYLPHIFDSNSFELDFISNFSQIFKDHFESTFL
jgi:hypothetical protein